MRGTNSEKKIRVVFQSCGCEIFNPEGKLVSTGVIENDLFKLEQHEVIDQAMLSFVTTFIKIWHKRMGHLHYNSVKKVANGKASGIRITGETYDDCGVCPMKERSRMLFSKSLSRVKE